MGSACFRIAATPIMRLLLLVVAYGLYPVSIAQGATLYVSASQSIQAAIKKLKDTE